ncbi:Beta-glucuronidase [Amphibalanus amphitrite]|uniref:Beta-glucuronidase n=1 Tax=Amphibalanus amphitrite TaxID=1232801 RepID=A0A6A4VMZ2_AMPAM|nr:Beta-glucuronidase [Amphibalanus amphitrite]
MWPFLATLSLYLTLLSPASSLLYPRASESRDLVSLDGIWQFRVSPPGDPNAGFREAWYSARLSESGTTIPMPVPCSFNDITADDEIRNYIGWAWYDRELYVPSGWSDRRVVLRFGSVNYNAVVWVNGHSAGSHEGGHLPFELEVTSLLKMGAANWLTVAVNNTLDLETIPQGKITFKDDTTRYPEGYFEQSYNFEYFHYAGIHRSVQLFTTPLAVHIQDITITTNFSTDSSGLWTAYVSYEVDVVRSAKASARSSLVKIRDQRGRAVHFKSLPLLPKNGRIRGMVTIPNATLWWPVGMGETPGFQYTLEVVETADTATRRGGSEMDVYRQLFGVRTVTWDSDRLYVNNRPFYFRGFGKHEDANIVGRGLSLPLIMRDINLIVWSGANSFRTSHYPYAEELLDQTDAAGIVVIDESPAIGLEGFGATLLAKHKRVMEELVARDKNRPSVLVWSLGNEPQSAEEAAGPYFKAVYDHTRALDPTRAITTVVSVGADKDQASASMDLVLINRYFGWYSDSGRAEVIERQMLTEAAAWRRTFGKPLVVSEYGAGSVAGLRDLPAFIWTEDYQAEFLRQYHKAFDKLISTETWFAGEMVWNFADFAVPREYIRPQFCMKGMFTRERKPKLAAYVLRDRYTRLAELEAARWTPKV